MMYTNSPSVFNMVKLSSGMSALSYAPGTSKMATFIPSFASMIRLVNRAAKDMVREYTSSLCMYYLCGLTSAQFLPFNFPHFSFISLLLTGLPFFDFVVLWGSSAPIMFISYSSVYSLYMYIISLLTCLFIPFLAVICVNVVSTAIFCISWMNSFSFSSILMNWFPYFFPPNFISRISKYFPTFDLLCLILLLSRHLVYTSLDFTVSLSVYTGAFWSLVSVWFFSFSGCSLSSFFCLWYHTWQ